MANQTVASLTTTTAQVLDLHIGKQDRQVLRDLAYRVAELIARPIEAEKKKSAGKANAGTGDLLRSGKRME